MTEKVLEPEGNQSGNGGFTTEKDIDERICFFHIFVVVLPPDPLLMHET